MNDWISGSRRVQLTGAITIGLWLLGGIGVLISPRGASPLGAAAGWLLALSLAVSGIVSVWSAVSVPRRTWITRFWWLVALGIAIDAAAGWRVLVRPIVSAGSLGPFEDSVRTLLIGSALICVALLYSCWSLRRTPGIGVLVLAASGVALAIYACFIAALIAPGPSMPFSIGPYDTEGIIRITVDVWLLLLPAMVSVLAILRWPDGQRARPWMWVGIGALVWGMADAAFPLVSRPFGQIYPMMLWIFGVSVSAMGIALAADLEGAAAANGAQPYGPASPAEGALAPSESSEPATAAP
jgi:hypothetical protein